MEEIFDKKTFSYVKLYKFILEKVFKEIDLAYFNFIILM